MKDKKLLKRVAKRSCDEGLAWLKTQRGPQSAWKACTRPDWMLWALNWFGPGETAVYYLRMEVSRWANEKYKTDIVVFPWGTSRLTPQQAKAICDYIRAKYPKFPL
jgi:hypothetical protein